MLKGTRTLSTARFDLLLKSLNCSVLDLFQDEELETHLAVGSGWQPACTALPLRPTALGPGQPWPADENYEESYPVPSALIRADTRLALVRLEPDPCMRRSLGSRTVAAVELISHPQTHAEGLYAVDRGRDTVLRGLRRGADKLYLLSDEDRNDPLRWETVPAAHSSGRSPIRGKVIWLNDEKPRKPPRREDGHFLDDATSWYVART